MNRLRTQVPSAALLLACAFTVGCATSASVPLVNEPTVTTGKKDETGRAPVKPTAGDSKTPEEASRRAADPKDPSGALIVGPPAGGASGGALAGYGSGR